MRTQWTLQQTELVLVPYQSRHIILSHNQTRQNLKQTRIFRSNRHSPLTARASSPNSGTAAKQLTRDIKRTTSVEDLLHALDSNKSVINVRHLSFALLHLAQLLSAERNNGDVDLKGVSLKQHPAVEWIIDQLFDTSENDWNGIVVANVFRSGYELNNTRLIQKSQSIILSSSCTELGVDSILSILRTMVKRKTSITDAFMHKLDAWIRKEETNEKDLWTLAFELTELQCSEAVADIVYNQGMLYSLDWRSNLELRQLSYLVRLAAERGNVTNARANALCFAHAIQSNKHLFKPSAPWFARDVSFLYFNYAKLVQKATQKMEQDQDIFTATNRFFEIQIQKALPMMNCLDISSTITGCRYLQQSSSPIVPLVAQRSLDIVSHMDTIGLSTVALGLATLKFDCEEFLERAALILNKRIKNSSSSSSSSYPVSVAIEFLYAIVVLNRSHGHNVCTLLPSLIARLIPALPSLDPNKNNYLALVGWSLVVIKGHPDSPVGAHTELTMQALRAWRRCVIDKSQLIPKDQLTMIQHVDIALRIECPDLGSDEPREYESFFHSLYDYGRLRRRAGEEWDAQLDVFHSSIQSIDIKTGSKFQRDVHRIANEIIKDNFLEWDFEYWERNLHYPIDMALRQYKVCIEADGPTHYTSNTYRPMGHTLFKRRLLSQLGWSVASVPLFQWTKLKGDDEKKTYIISKIEKETGVSLERLTSRGSNGDATNLSDDQSYALHQADQQNEAEHKHRPSSMADQPAVVNERAQRMDVLKLKQGKMTRSDAILKAARRKNGGTSAGRALGSTNTLASDYSPSPAVPS